jgi:hypothetical protein
MAAPPEMTVLPAGHDTECSRSLSVPEPKGSTATVLADRTISKPDTPGGPGAPGVPGAPGEPVGPVGPVTPPIVVDVARVEVVSTARCPATVVRVVRAFVEPSLPHPAMSATKANSPQNRRIDRGIHPGLVESVVGRRNHSTGGQELTISLNLRQADSARLAGRGAATSRSTQGRPREAAAARRRCATRRARSGFRHEQRPPFRR